MRSLRFRVWVLLAGVNGDALYDLREQLADFIGKCERRQFLLSRLAQRLLSLRNGPTGRHRSIILADGGVRRP